MSSSPSDQMNPNGAMGSQLSQSVLSNPQNHNSDPHLPFSSMMSSTNQPLLLTNNEQENMNEKSTSLSLLQQAYDSQSLQLKYLVEREREAKKVSNFHSSLSFSLDSPC